MIIRYNELVGNTPLLYMEDNCLDNINLYLKFEGNNPTGSIKDRAAKYVLTKLINSKEITHDTVIIESSSGNMGIALANYCKLLNLKCEIVIDPNILPCNERVIQTLATEVHKVAERDINGSYLMTRLQLIKEKISDNPNKYYWINQYGNPYVAEAYYSTIGQELCDEINIDYIFIGVSSGGTITGISRKVKEYYPQAKVIAVDTVGSVVFGDNPKKRFIPGIGSSLRPSIIDHALIDEIVLTEEIEAINNCHKFFKEHLLCIGGSSGSVYTAMLKYFKNKKFDKKPNVVAVFADRGDHYLDTVYNDKWISKNFV